MALGGSPIAHFVATVLVTIASIAIAWSATQATANGAVSILVRYWDGDPRQSVFAQLAEVKSAVKNLAAIHARSQTLLQIVSALEHLRIRPCAVSNHMLGILSSDSELCSDAPDAPDTLVFVHHQKRWAEDVAQSWSANEWFEEGFSTSTARWNEIWREALVLCVKTLTANHQELAIDAKQALTSPTLPSLPKAVRFIFGGTSNLDGLKMRWHSHLKIWDGENRHFWALWPEAHWNNTDSAFDAKCLNILLPYAARTASVKRWLDGKEGDSFFPCGIACKDLLGFLVPASGLTTADLLRLLGTDDALRASGEFNDQLYVGSIIALGTRMETGMERAEPKICGMLYRDLPFFLMLLHHKRAVLFPEFLWWLIDASQVEATSTDRLQRAKNWMEKP